VNRAQHVVAPMLCPYRDYFCLGPHEAHRATSSRGSAPPRPPLQPPHWTPPSTCAPSRLTPLSSSLEPSGASGAAHWLAQPFPRRNFGQPRPPPPGSDAPTWRRLPRPQILHQ
jgi:hypothetical protein